MSANESLNKFKNTPKKLSSFLFSFEGKRILLMLLTFSLVTLVLCSKYLTLNAVIDEKGFAKQDIFAGRTIEIVDSEATTQKRMEVRDKVKPVYKPVEGNVDDIMERNLEDLLDSISLSRKKLYMARNNPVQTVILFQNSPIRSFNKSISTYILREATDYNWQNIQVKSRQIVQSILNSGISAKEISEGKIDLIRSYFSRSTSESNQEAVIAIADYAINQPNIIIDEKATAMAQNNAMDVVENVKIYFKKGQIIVEKGLKPTNLEMEALKKLGYTVDKINFQVFFGIVFFVIGSMLIFWYYLSRYEQEYANSIKHLSLFSAFAVVSLLLMRLIPELPRIFQMEIPVYIIPFAVFTLLLTFFANSRVAILETFLVIFLVSVVFRFAEIDMLVLAIGSLIAVIRTGKMDYYRDIKLIEIGIAVAMAQVIIVASDYFLTNSLYEAMQIHELIIKIVIAATSGLLTGALTIAALPYLEVIFNIITVHGLMEFADLNQPLLRRLQFEAPGTYHHSLMVSTLAEAAAEAIGASTILVRVGALYHDVGKLKRPAFFIENQAYFGTENPHDKLNPRLSKMVLSAHTKDGFEIARKYNLPESVQEMIIAHHGDGIMLYFYREALELEGPEKVLKDQFRYMGPKPATKEAAIIMLADATESAVRSLKSPSLAMIEERIAKIIDERLADDQLSETDLTLKDIKIMAYTFTRVLKGMQHDRIEYNDNTLEELHKKQAEHGKTHRAPLNLVKKEDGISILSQDAINKGNTNI